MADSEEFAGQGEPAPGSEHQQEHAATDTPGDAGQGQPYLGTFKTREDAEKGLSDLQRILNDARRRESEAKTQLERDNQLAATLKAIAEQKSKPGEGGPSKADQIKAAREAWAAKFNEKGNGEMVLELIDDLEAARAGGSASEVAELKRQLTEVTATLSEYDPTWQQAKTDVEEFGLKEKFPNLDHKTLAAMASEMRKLKPIQVAQPSRPDLPGATGGIAGGQGGSRGAISNAEFAQIEAEAPQEIHDRQHIWQQRRGPHRGLVQNNPSQTQFDLRRHRVRRRHRPRRRHRQGGPGGQDAGR
jgi:hypothetical protein